ncbi:hypothetical protein B0H13DRAFT_1856170 [Mycena leptocephala]|nr:hypothetical protein B0H13DRAFT_1856170 [Mycena leptocephala]
MQGNSSGRGRAPRFRESQATELDANGTKDCHRKSSTQAPSNVSTSASASDVTVADETIRDAPPKCRPSEGVGDREGRHQHECGGICSECLDRFRVNMTLGACQIDTDELGHCLITSSVLRYLCHRVSWIHRPEDRGQPWRGDLL